MTAIGRRGSAIIIVALVRTVAPPESPRISWSHQAREIKSVSSKVVDQNQDQCSAADASNLAQVFDC